MYETKETMTDRQQRLRTWQRRQQRLQETLQKNMENRKRCEEATKLY